MPTFFGRRYMRRVGDVGRTEKVLGALILLLTVTIIAGFAIQIATNKDYLFSVDERSYASIDQPASSSAVEGDAPAATAAKNPFPGPGIEGWQVPTRVDRFNAENLYIEIDGRAAAYLQHGVVGLTVGTYTHEHDPNRTVDVYWYDMGSPANALAMYKSELPPEATPLALGRAGYQVGGAVFFCKGSAYVQVIPSGLDDADTRVALRIAELMADRIED